MNIASRTRGRIAALLVLACVAASPSYAQNVVNVNTVPCPTATVTFGAGTINISTAGCAGGPVVSPPSISSLSVASGLPNQAVTINGANLTNASVTIGGVGAAIASNNGSAISTSVPASAAVGAGNVIVTVAGLAPAQTPFTVLAPPPPAAPTISSVSPASGSAGTVVAISGTGFSAATVTIGGAAATFTSSATTITATVPAAATIGAGNVVVTVAGFPPASSAFTVVAPPPPVISSVSPASGGINSVVTISGTGLAGATATIGGAVATVATSSPTSITTTVPATAVVGVGSVVVTSGGGTATSAFTVTLAAPGTVSIDGLTIPNPSKSAFIIPAHGGLNGAGPEVNAYAMDPTQCATTPALSRRWQHNIDLSDYKSKNGLDYFGLQANESLSYRFTVGNVDAGGGFSFSEATNAAPRPSFMTITTAPCDFDTTRAASGPNRSACYQPGLSGNSVSWANITGPLPVSYCRLVKGQTYYLNIRFQDARPASEGGSPTTDACNAGTCGGILQVN